MSVLIMRRARQVQKDFRDRSDYVEDVAPASTSSMGDEAWVASALEFLTKESQKDPADRSQRRWRAKAYEWLLCTNNQLQVMSGCGWDAWRIPAKPEERPPVEAWGVLTLCIDQGPDGWSAQHFLRDRGVCFALLHDPCHRRWNDTLLALRDTGLYGAMCVLVCMLNADHAPWGECRRGAGVVTPCVRQGLGRGCRGAVSFGGGRHGRGRVRMCAGVFRRMFVFMWVSLVCMLSSRVDMLFHSALRFCSALHRWFQSGREAIQCYIRTTQASHCPLFRAFFPHMLNDTGDLHRRTDPQAETEAGALTHHISGEACVWAGLACGLVWAQVGGQGCNHTSARVCALVCMFGVGLLVDMKLVCFYPKLQSFEVPHDDGRASVALRCGRVWRSHGSARTAKSESADGSGSAQPSASSFHSGTVGRWLSCTWC